MESIKVAIQLHWFLWPPRYVKLVNSVLTRSPSRDASDSRRRDRNLTESALHVI